MPRRETAELQRWRRVVRLLPLVLAVFYLTFHAISGERGIVAWFKAEHQLKQLREELTRVQAERAVYENKMKGMRPQSLDLDLVEEEARKTLGYVAKDEIVVPDDAPQHK